MELWKHNPAADTKLWPEGKVPMKDNERPIKNLEQELWQRNLVVTDINDPFFTFFPAKGDGARPVVVILPGGGYWQLGWNKEGTEIADWLNSLGFSAAVLLYRAPNQRDAALCDVQRAIGILRRDAAKYGIDPGRVGVIGFSAGAMLSGNIATHPDDGQPESPDPVERFNNHVDAAVIGYGAFSFVSFPRPLFMPFKGSVLEGRTPEEMYYLSLEKHVEPTTPPMFIWQTMSDDGRHGMTLAKALQDAGVPYELHIFTSGIHGLAMADGHNDLGMDIPHVAHWGKLCAEWLEEMGI